MNAPDRLKVKEGWDDTDGYEMYVGRWSRLISMSFVDWLQPDLNSKWLEFGCGTGVLTKIINQKCQPSYLLALDKSEAYLEAAGKKVKSENVSFLKADLSLQQLTDNYDYITSGLVLNFLPQVTETLSGLLNNLKSFGQMSSFVWDYAGHYQPMRHFWDAAKEIVEGVEKFDAGNKFEICDEKRLTQLFKTIGLTQIEFIRFEHIATFKDFDDYWLPITSAQGSVTEFLSTLNHSQKSELRAILKQRLPIAADGELKLIISALGVKGFKK